MKSFLKHIAIVGFIGTLWSLTGSAQQTLPFYEPFDASYTNGGALMTVNGVSDVGRSLLAGSGNVIWSIGGGSGGGDPICHAGAKMTVPSLGVSATPDVGLFLTNTASGNRTRGIQFTDTSSGKLYASFLLNVAVAPTANRLITTLTSTSANFANASVVGVFVDTSKQLLVSKNSSTGPGTATTTPLNAGANLVVVRYTWNPTDADDEVALWLNPSSSTFNGAEGSVPTPTITQTNGTDFANLNSFFIQQRNNTSIAGAQLLLDDIRIGTTWASVTPTGVSCTPAGINNSPANASVTEGSVVVLSGLASGSSPSYQWQSSTDGGATWSNVSDATTSTYFTKPMLLSDNNKKFRFIANVACGGGSSATSGVATVTVNAATATAAGLVLDDFWLDGDRANTPVATNNSQWFASSDAASLTATAGKMIGTPASGSSRIWIGYFTESNTPPVHLAVGSTLKSKLVFTPTGFTAFTNGGNTIRFGLFNYADGGTRVGADGFSNSGGNGAKVNGYMTVLNFGQTFNTATPLALYVRNQITDANLLGSTAPFVSMQSGPVGGTYSNTPAFQAGTSYTLELNVTRNTETSATVETHLKGGTLDLAYSTNDSTYAYHRFDAVAFRPQSVETTADTFEFTEFKVEVTNSVVLPPSPIPLQAALSGSNVVLTWTNSAFALQAAPEAVGTYTNVTGATSPYSTPASAGRKFFRLIAQ